MRWWGRFRQYTIFRRGYTMVFINFGVLVWHVNLGWIVLVKFGICYPCILKQMGYYYVHIVKCQKVLRLQGQKICMLAFWKWCRLETKQGASASRFTVTLYDYLNCILLISSGIHIFRPESARTLFWLKLLTILANKT